MRFSGAHTLYFTTQSQFSYLCVIKKMPYNSKTEKI